MFAEWLLQFWSYLVGWYARSEPDYPAKVQYVVPAAWRSDNVPAS
jgi:hypothetical protein